MSLGDAVQELAIGTDSFIQCRQFLLIPQCSNVVQMFLKVPVDVRVDLFTHVGTTIEGRQHTKHEAYLIVGVQRNRRLGLGNP